MFSYSPNWKEHNESVYGAAASSNCSPQECKPLYRSKFSCMVRHKFQNEKVGCYGTFGVPFVQLNPPDCYLKKQSKLPMSKLLPKAKKEMAQPEKAEECQEAGNAQTVAVDDQCCNQGEENPVNGCIPDPVQVAANSRCCLADCRKPQLPNNAGTKVIPRGSKDYVKDNAIDVIRMPAKIPETRLVDEAKGHSYDWCNSGLARKFVCKSDYGMIPGYLVDRKNELYQNDLQEKCQMEQQQLDQVGKCSHMDEDQRQELICGLKNAWAETFREYQKLPLAIDTQGKVDRKNSLETCLKELERDLQILARQNHVFIANTDHTFYL